MASVVRRHALGAPNMLISEIAEQAKQAYIALKKKRVEDTVLRPFLGLDFQGFQALVAQSASSQILGQVMGFVVQHNLELDLLVAGLDAEGAHLYGVTHPGILNPLETMGFAAVGSGATHAIIRLCLQRQTRGNSLAESVYNVYAAKRSSEIAPGVGRVTDMAVIKDGKTTTLADAVLDVLNDTPQGQPALDGKYLKAVQDAVQRSFSPEAQQS